MAMRVKPDIGEIGVKQRYRVTNWAEYDRALVNRGNLTIWFDDESIRDHWTPPPPEGRGTPGRYSDVATPDVPDDQGTVPVALPGDGRIGEVADAPVPPGPAGTGPQ